MHLVTVSCPYGMLFIFVMLSSRLRATQDPQLASLLSLLKHLTFQKNSFLAFKTSSPVCLMRIVSLCRAKLCVSPFFTLLQNMLQVKLAPPSQAAGIKGKSNSLAHV